GEAHGGARRHAGGGRPPVEAALSGGPHAGVAAARASPRGPAGGGRGRRTAGGRRPRVGRRGPAAARRDELGDAAPRPVRGGGRPAAPPRAPARRLTARPRGCVPAVLRWPRAEVLRIDGPVHLHTAPANGEGRVRR